MSQSLSQLKAVELGFHISMAVSHWLSTAPSNWALGFRNLGEAALVAL